MIGDWYSRLVRCTECEGTGAADPTCWCCLGNRSIKLRRAYAFGYRKSDLSDVDDGDGMCECPVCDGCACGFCEGDGTTWPEVEESHRRRILITARTGVLPPVWVQGFRGRMEPREHLLSARVCAEMAEEGLVWRLNSIFGHELSLTDAGERAYEEMYRCD